MKITIYVLIVISIINLLAIKLNMAPALNDSLYARTDIPLTGYKSY